MSNKSFTGTFYGTTREDEEKKLIRIQRIAEEKVESIKGVAAGLQDELKSLREVYDTEDKEGLAQWFNTDSRFQEVRNDLRRAERALKKPFFGRIDIVDEENAKKETFYIGKSVIAENPSEPEVIDWRAPISSVYYDHSLGKCKYKVPKEGIFEVDLQRKRTYEIEDEKIKDFFDSDVVANDDLLTKYLSKSKRNVLSEIIATIQQEQNEVIRRNPRHNVLVQGSAGSGKTTVAMHRISYILYNYDTEFKPDGFYIVGSNKVLLNYITGVLPDLDVYGVKQMTMEELFTRLLYEDWDKDTMTIKKLDKKDKSVGIKGTEEWFDDVKAFCDEVEWNHIPREDIRIEKNNRLILRKADIEKAIKEYPEWSMAQKFERLTDLLLSRLETEIYGRYYSYNVEEQKKLTKFYRDYFNRYVWKNSVFDLYQTFVEKEMVKHPDISFDKKEPDLYDLASLAYIYKRIKETEVIQEASHVVIDEAQDFGMMVYCALKYCMSKCTFTIMGDVSQNINFGCGLSDWEGLKKVMLPDPYDYFGLLRKSYRNTVEISQYATDILRHGTFPIYPVEPIIRHGDEVANIPCKDLFDLNAKVSSKIKEFVEKDYETIAVICKDEKEAEEAYKALSKETEVKLFSQDVEFAKGTFVLPIEYSKGLEFDAVIIYDASKEAYPLNDDYAKLLYVAATRALHELSVFFRGELTGLVRDPIPEDRKDITFAEDDFHLDPYVFEEEFKSKEELAKEQAAIGDLELKEREKYGPKRIEPIPVAVKEEKPVERNTFAAYEEKASQKPVAGSFADFGKLSGTYTKSNSNTATSPYTSAGIKPVARPTARPKAVAPVKYGTPIVDFEKSHPVIVKPRAPKDTESLEEFGRMPDGTSISPVGHGKIDNGVRWIKADKSKVDITGGYGTLRIMPISPETVRVMFFKNEPDKVKAVPEELAGNPGKWNCVENRENIEIRMEKLTLIITKKTGEISFFGSNKNLLLKENAGVARQYHGMEDTWWVFFEWSKKEVLNIRGKEDSDWKEMGVSAKYISHGKSDRAALVMSNKGYQIIVAAGIKTLLCTVPAYGPYLCFEESQCIDYFFRSAR